MPKPLFFVAKICILTGLYIGGQFAYSQESVPSVASDRNWSSSISYDLSGATISKGVSFFNTLGNGTQQQRWNILTDRVWASEVRYDYFGRPVLQSLSAPVGTGFFYRSNFIMVGSSPLSVNDYDAPGTQFNPSSITGASSTLGWYYSSANTLDPYQDITSYPFTRTVLSDLNPGKVRAMVGGNKLLVNGVSQWLQSYSFVMPIEREVGTSSFYDAFRDKKITKSVSRDVHGIERVTFTDSDGNQLGAARSGNEENTLSVRTVFSEILDKGYVDIHIPVGCGGLVVVENITAGNTIRIFDLVSEQIVAPTLTGNITLSSGFYRFEDQTNFYGNNNSVDNPITPVKVKYQVNYYDLSYNDYDYAGRLLKSVQPISATIAGDKLESNFKYNSLGQVLSSTSPDEGTSNFKYRRDGQIRFSQNQEQAKVNAFSYTNYDDLGRPVESGVYTGTGILFANTAAILDVSDGLPLAGRSEMQTTQYDLPKALELIDLLGRCNLPSAEYMQTFVAGNVSYTRTLGASAHQTWYSYDVFGRLKWMVQLLPMRCPQTIDYEYNPVNGQILKIIYQKHNAAETFIHKYDYSPAGQLTDVYTAVDIVATAPYTHQAHYIYNESGALTRTELADNLQGIDYVYSLGGQLKAINHPSLLTANDPGGDGGNGIAGDVFGLALDYYAGDYTRSGTPKPITSTLQGNNQYSGNIKASRWNTQSASTTQNAYTYSYNKNSWITGATFGSANSSSVFTPNASGDYQEGNITYDANGNIKTLKRNGYTGSGTNSMDDFEYKNTGNKLDYVKDSGDNTDVNRYNDIRDQDLPVQTGTISGNPVYTHLPNYLYNDLGQLTANLQEKITYSYKASGLVSEIGEMADTNTQNFITLHYEDYPVALGNTPHLQYLFPEYICAGLANSTIFTSFIRKEEGLGTKVISRVRVTPNTFMKLDLDLLVDKKLVITPPPPNPGDPIEPIIDGEEDPATVGPEVIPQVIVNLRKPDGTLIATQTITNQSAEYCNRFFDEHVNMSFTSGTEEYVVLEMEVSNNQSSPSDGTQRVFIDNIHLQAAKKTRVAFFYNERGQRIKKSSYASGGYTTNTYYVRDAGGTCMGVYKEDLGPLTEHPVPQLIENGIYGSGRIGLFKRDQSRDKGYALYQLTDHLGNVRAVIRKTTAGLLAVTAKTDYYPFGMPMPNKHTTDGNYRYAFQGQEKDTETGMEAFELRLWEARLGRWLTVDPKHEFQSPYIGMGNNPISLTDPDGGSTEIEPTRKAIAGEFYYDASDNTAYMGNADGSWTQATELDTVLVEKVAVTFAGALNAWSSNNLMGAGRADPATVGQYELNYRYGQLAGDMASTVTGACEMLAGGLGMLGGSALAIPSGGTSTVLIVASATLAGHGTAVVFNGVVNTHRSIEGINEYNAKDNHSSSSSSNSGGGNYKKVSSNKDADSYAASKGYRDAHDLKRAHDVGSEFDIFVDSKTGKGVLMNKNQKIKIPID